jgi:hypothetical protein
MLSLLANTETLITPVNLLMTALSSVTGVLGVVVKQLYARMIKAEEKLEKMQEKVDELTELEASASAKVEMYQNCPKRVECPFARSEHFVSLKNNPFQPPHPL